MQKKLFIGGLSHSMDKDKVRELFTVYGEVETVTIIEGKGFGFVEMSSQSEAEAAKKELNESFFKGRTIRVDEAKPPRGREGRRRR
jgi:RNA recognition motif-containing protein